MRNEIVVGLDDSPSSKAALDWAAEQAASMGAVLRAVHALDWPYGLSSAGFPAPANLMNVSHKELQEAYRQAITAVFEAISPPPDWILQFASGDARKVLVEQSEDARMLVMGTREHVGLGRLLNGSVSHYCLSHAVCPVVAVPAPLSDRRMDSDTVGPGITATDQDMAAALRAPDRVVDESEAPATTLVVAGVDASAESIAAARYAVAAAEMRGCDVVLVHAFPPPLALTADREAAFSAARTAAETLLATVVAQLIVPPQLRIYTRAEPGETVAALKGAASETGVLVLGRDRVSWGERLFMGAVGSQIVGQVPCPLVIVPDHWRARPWPRQPVIVALDGEADPSPALTLAFQEAMLRDARLVALHAQPMSASAREVAAARLDLADVLAKWEQDHPDVAVSAVIVSGDPDAHLVRWSRSAAVLVVGHPQQRSWGPWTRSVARSVMRQTHCPLIVAPPAAAELGRPWTLADQART